MPIPNESADRQRLRVLWWLPRLAFGAFIVVVMALLWYSDRSTRDEQRATLLSDVLWLEQNIKFLLEHNEELLARLDPKRWQATTSFEAEAQMLLANKSGLRRVRWLDAGLRQARALPPQPAQDAADADDASQQVAMARLLGRPVYGPPRQVADEWEFSVYLPQFHDGAYQGTAIGSYSLRRLLEGSVPWWLTERYRIVVLDADGGVLAERSRVADVDAERAYQTPFDPPGHGLLLSATPYYTPTPLAGRILSVALLALALLVLASLWALRRHVQGRLAAESAQRQEVAFRTAMEDSLQTGLRARDLQGRITYVNPAFCRMVGWPPEELVGLSPPMPYWAEEHIEETRAMNQRVLAGDSPSDGFEIRFRRRDGEIFDALIHEAPLIDDRGRHTGWMGSVVDITERKRTAEAVRLHEQRLQASARLITMGEMASSLAHELNQPLAAISSYLTGCRNLIAAGRTSLGELDGVLGKCQDQAQRAARIIRRIYEFVRRHEAKSEDCDLVELIHDLLALLDADIRRQGVGLEHDLPAAPVDIVGDRVLLGQALLNLIRNGLEAMREMPREARRLTLKLRLLPDGVEIRVQDTGCGLPASVAEHLFEPFFTTKSEGLGVGLSICRSVIEAHHGRLWHEPNPGGGSCFCVRLPVGAKESP